MRPHRLYCLTLLGLWMGLPVWGQEASPSAAQPSSSVPTLTADGLFIRDPRAHLEWPRCVEGMSWNGKTCMGQPRLMTYAEAQALALERTRAEGVTWRLPRLNELKRWSNAEGKDLFPNAPDEWTWTSTKRIDTVQSNSYNYGNIQQGRGGAQEMVGVNQGFAWLPGAGQARGDVSHKTALVVRLVRAAR